MASGLTEDQLKALIDAEMRQSVGYFGGKLAEMRRKAEYYYLGLPKGDLAPPEIEGRSNVVVTTGRNTILWMLPTLMKTFCAGDNVVEFTPTQQDDEDKAKLATDYINYLFYKQNPGFQIVHTWFQDALVQKVGILKVWWDNREEQTREEYRALPDVELAMLLDDPEVEPIEHKAYPDEDDAKQRQQALQQLAQQMQANPQAAPQIQQQIAQIQAQPPVMLHDVTLKRTKKSGKIAVENVPPEEFMISRKSKRITDGFCGHRVLRTISDLKAMGYKGVDKLAGDDAAVSMNMERVERIGYDDEQPYIQEDESLDPSQRKVWITECYLKADVDGDGIAEWRKIVKCGNEILEDEECDGPPFVAITPLPLPHRFFGMSIMDLAMEPQRIQTSLIRAELDNTYLQVNGRYYAVEGQVNLDDLLTSRPGGVVRIKSPGAVGRLDQSAADLRSTESLRQWFDDFTENSTGWTKYSQGASSDSLNKTATGVNIITNKADMRLELIARQFAETGFTDLFRLILKLVCQHQDKKSMVKLGSKWVPIDPREWRNQFDLSINVGLGTGNKDQQVQHLLTLHQQQLQGLQFGISTPKNLFNSATKLTENLGFKNAEAYWTDPSQQQPQPQQPNPEALKAQADQQKHAAEMQMQQQRMQAEQAMKQQEMQMQMELEQYKAQMQAQTAAKLEEIKGEYALMIAKLNAGQKQDEIVTQAHVDLVQAQAEHERSMVDLHMSHQREMNKPEPPIEY